MASVTGFVQTKGMTNMGIWTRLRARWIFHSNTWSSLRDTALVEKGIIIDDDDDDGLEKEVGTREVVLAPLTRGDSGFPPAEVAAEAAETSLHLAIATCRHLLCCLAATESGNMAAAGQDGSIWKLEGVKRRNGQLWLDVPCYN